MSHQDNENNQKKEIDKVSGVETTGHEWDGLKELNNPLPRWWVWVFLATCIWSVWYWVVYPAWPTISGHTQGIGGHSQFVELENSQQEIIARQQTYLDKFEKASFDEILNDSELYAFATAGGASAFKDNCATCHGTGAEGGKGYPNLNDDDWLWGGTLEDIHQTLEYGIRAGNEDTRLSQMPAFGKEKTLNRNEIYAVVDYVLTLSGEKQRETYAQGAQIFQAQCASCHGAEGKGSRDVGAPNLTDKIWLYGGDRQTLYQTVYSARAGVMPSWHGRLNDNTIKQLTIYLHQLGGGEEEINNDQEPVTE
ncbi:MAG: cytochrome-c oxidase, cbb3-type subunit III [Alphaproteobacteria bacterium]|nr:cytochrome-c oxidase, cbb3-type subunit III [Alphaproteobacteria bacterium]